MKTPAYTFYVFLILVLNASITRATEKEIFLRCEGKYVTSAFPDPIEIESSFFIGRKLVEQEGRKFSICRETKTIIEFSDSCQKKKIFGTIDLVFKKIFIENNDPPKPLTMTHFECVAVEKLRR